MMSEPTSLSTALYRVGETLDAVYGIDPQRLYRQLGVDPDGPADAGSRQPNHLITEMYDLGAKASGDPAFGINVGLHSAPRHYFVIGHVWLASATLKDAIDKLLRYETILNSGDTDLRFDRRDDAYVLSERYPNPADYPGKLRSDAAIASVLKLCRLATGADVILKRMELFVPEGTDVGIYRRFVDGPIVVNDERNALFFPKAAIDAPLSGGIPDVVDATCHLAERYLESLDRSRIAHQVRAEIVRMLPGGSTDQKRVASRMHRSSSTLQRQLKSEGTTYREVLDSTRRELAETYLRSHRHSLAQVAFLVGFSDQRNFTRAFRRWTGVTPGQYRKAS